MNDRVPRTCTEILPQKQGNRESRPLKEFRSAAAYVLLGDPGSGKTTAFEAERDALGDSAHLISGSDFLALDMDSHPEWRNKILYIDGLDEIRARAANAHTPFDQVRGRLDRLGRPRFRLSCREADWLGDNDRRHLAAVAQNSQVRVLRLDPLNEKGVVSILNGCPGTDDAEAFIRSAQERGVEGLLKNPMSLKMLSEAVAYGKGWPESRLETFEKACSKIAQEHNRNHEIAVQPSTSIQFDLYTFEQLMNAAGHLCAVHLLAGTAGYARSNSDADRDYPTPDACTGAFPGVLLRALSTKLFQSTSRHHLVPVHRHIAEFLGARHIARAIEDGLPARRVLALMAGDDGTVVTEMRGLSAWLAAHCGKARADLIGRDPIGVGLYGDIRQFSRDEKQALLKALRREDDRLVTLLWPSTAAPFAALATSDMEPVLKEILTSPSRTRDHQMLAAFVLKVLGKSAALPGLSQILLEIVRDHTWWPLINESALDAFIHLHNSQDKTTELTVLLADIQAERVSDPSQELLGRLLTLIYPLALAPSEVWGYLWETGDVELIGAYRKFWNTELVQKSSPDHLAELLDSLVRRLPRLRPALDARRLSGLPAKILAAGLEARGDHIQTGRLYDWLSAGLHGLDVAPAHDTNESIGQIGSWLTQRPETQKRVIAEGLDRQPETDNLRFHAHNVQMRLYGAGRPADYGLWCLKTAVVLADAKPQVAEYLFEEAVWAHRNRRGNQGLSLEVLQKHAGANQRLSKILDRLLAPPPAPPQPLEREAESTDEESRQQRQRLDHVRANRSALRENRAAPALLHRLAEGYFGCLYELDRNEGPNAIAKLLEGDHDLIDASLVGLRGVVEREDVPGIDEILELRRKSRMHYLGAPFLAGLAEMERAAPQDPRQWDEDRVHKAVAFLYCSPQVHCSPHGNDRPQWYQRLIETRPEIVAEVQTRYAVSEFHSGAEHIHRLSELAHDPGHAQVARHASLPLLRAFPARCKLKQIRALDDLLWAAIRHADRALLEELIKRKKSRKSLNVAQRAHWLAAGLVVSPDVYKDTLQDFAQTSETRAWHLAGFLCDIRDSRFLLNELGLVGSELLVRLFGRWVGPDQQLVRGAVTLAAKTSRLVHELIQHLAASPTREASDALGRLLEDRGTSRWRGVLLPARGAQRVVRRDAGYRHLDVEQVCRTLNGGAPANAADLAALVKDNLCELAVKIRTGNTDDWRQYWNERDNGKPGTPKHEDACRDALLSDLRERLPQGVDAQPEGQYARDKRADMRVSCRDFQIPVEVKKNGHRDLWTAMQNQLIRQYTIDPATGGYGIYLVFWFGPGDTQTPLSGPRPASPKELKKKLEATLTEDQARKISVCVIDLSGDANVSGA